MRATLFTLCLVATCNWLAKGVRNSIAREQMLEGKHFSLSLSPGGSVEENQGADSHSSWEAPKSIPSLVQLDTKGNLVTAAEQKQGRLASYTFEDFVHEFGRKYAPGTAEWRHRSSVFESSLASAKAHNFGVPSATWTVGINKFMDYTKSEAERLLGHKGKRSRGSTSLIALEADEEVDLLPEVHDWRLRLHKNFRDQGACGSCWAIAAATTLEHHMSLRHNVSVSLSEQALVSCTPNPKKCGGSGGCKGATAEIAFQYIVEHGLPARANFPYSSDSGEDGTCTDELKTNKHVHISSFVSLPENKARPLLQALYQHGPVAVSVDGSNWLNYHSGVFSGCSRDAIINHAVVAEGWGKEVSLMHIKPIKYYLLRNSWGDDWGENGYMRLLRHDQDNEYCGIDNKPEEGTGCEGGPSQVSVCGMCGILYDAVYPVGGEFVTPEKGGTYVAEKV